MRVGGAALNRLADGLDGAIARVRGRSDFGGYLDITCDFAVYGAVPAACALPDPAANGAAAAVLLTSFYVNGTAFLGFAMLADRHRIETRAQGLKSLYYVGGLLEGGETIVFLALICALPGLFAPAAWIFASLCFVTAAARLALARGLFR